MKNTLKFVINALIIFFLAGLPIWVSQLFWHKVEPTLMFLIVPGWVYLLSRIESK